MTVVAESFNLNVARLLDLTLKCIDKFRLKQWSIPSSIYMFKVSKNRTTCQIYSDLTTETLVPGASIVNFDQFCTLFCCYYG